MELHLPHILAFLAFALVVSHAALPPEVYWNSVLPNTPMPKSVRDLLHPDLMEDKSTSVAVGKGGVNVDAGKGKPGGATVNVGKGGVNVNSGKGKPGKGTHVSVGGKGVGVNTGKPGKRTKVGVGKGGVSVSTGHKGKPVHVGLPEIYSEFSVKPGSMEAEVMKDTIQECENPGIRGEEKYCATSLESMIDFSTSNLGKNVKAISTEVENQTQMQKYTIKAVEKMAGEKSVVCHKQNYAYAVFYCHATHTTRAYRVRLEGADGTKAKAVAVCHTDTSAWNPKHLAFQVLNVKPGTVPVCHFLPQDHVVWVQN
ncbi:unnamed protein product [Dovyalis caffra]|uniref:BURP domain-containing protein n=1 Tax=Dovyalis caffra TaxID=77055 RepID=A0AAV1SLD5_9ROSI|nr:unnamed protein product [Dovyalis caffra]